MKPWLARALRRFVGTMVMVLGAEEALYRTLHARPELPPATVDRVKVATMDASRTITHPAAVARIVAILRTPDGVWSRFPERVCLLGTPHAEFYEGSLLRGRIVWGARSVGVQTRHATYMLGLSPAQGEELQRLFGMRLNVPRDTLRP